MCFQQIIDFDQRGRRVQNRLFKYYPLKEYHFKAFLDNQLYLASSSILNDRYDTSSVLIESFPHFKQMIGWTQQQGDILDSHGICSFIEAKDVKNARMWSLYADNFNGFALEFAPRRLENRSYAPIHLMPVTYLDKPLDLDNTKIKIKINEDIIRISDIATDDKLLDRVFQCMHLAKNKSVWQDENEWRMVVGNVRPKCCQKKGNGYLLPIDSSAYISIYIGDRVAKEYRDALAQVASSKGVNAFIVEPRIINGTWDMFVSEFACSPSR